MKTFLFSLKKKEISFLLLLSLCFFPIMPHGVISINIILFVLVSILLHHKNYNQRRNEISIRPLLIVSGFYIISMFTVLYSVNIDVSIKEIQRGLGIIVIPFCIFYLIPKIGNKKQNLLFIAFTIGNLLIIIKYIYHLIIILSERGYDTFLNFNFRGGILIHANIIPEPTYLCLGFSLSILFMIKTLFETHLLLKKTVITIGIFLFTIFIFLLSARTIIFSLLVSICLVSVIFFKNMLDVKKLVFFFLLVSSVLLITLQTKIFEGRFIKEMSLENFTAPCEDNLNSLSIRYGIYYCSSEIITRNPFFGVGIGDLQDVLNNCYQNFDTQVYKLKKMNAHNQYLQYFIVGGIMVLVPFLFFLFKSLQLSFKNNDIVYFVFLIILLVTFSTESILARIYGVVYFSIFNSIFYYRNIQNKNL